MAQKNGKKDSKELIKIIIVVVLFGVVGYLIFNNFINKPDLASREYPRRAVQQTGAISQQDKEIEDLQNMQLFLDSLVKYGDWPIEYNFDSVSGEYGRSNPFLKLEY